MGCCVFISVTCQRGHAECGAKGTAHQNRHCSWPRGPPCLESTLNLLEELQEGLRQSEQHRGL